MPTSNHTAYRADIDGLRAVAVLAVLLFHVDASWIPGGYVGVDVFFVISGYLITGVIAAQKEAGDFTYADFYRRRIKRLFPILFTVIVATMIAGSFILDEGANERLAISALAGAFFVANVFFTYNLDTGYFAPDAAFEPLLHLWSLGVEEQFYLIWPVVLGVFGAVWIRRSAGLSAVAVLSLSSFLLAEWLVRDHPMFAYYMLPTRAGELLVGVLAFGLVSRGVGQNLSPILRHCLALLGLGGIVWSFVALDNESVFPGLVAIPATAGAAAIIFAGAGRPNIVGRVLSLKPMVWIGLLSYSLYLWHWPVLAYLKYLIGDLNIWHQLAAISATFLLAIAGNYLIETPVRRSHASFRTMSIKAFGLPALLLTSLCAAVLATQGFGWRAFNDDYRRAVEAFSTASTHTVALPFVCFAADWAGRNAANPACRVNADGPPPVLLWGDSNAAHYVPALKVYAEEIGFGFFNIAHGLCPPFVSNPGHFTGADRREACNRSAQIVRESAGDYETIILAASWNTYLRSDDAGVRDALTQTIEDLRAGGARVIVLGRVPSQPGFDRDCDWKRLRVPFLECGAGSGVPESEITELNAIVSEVATRAGAEYYDFNQALCVDGLCRTTLNGYPVYFDAGHLSAQGSETVGRALVQTDEARRVFGSLADGVQASE